MFSTKIFNSHANPSSTTSTEFCHPSEHATQLDSLSIMATPCKTQMLGCSFVERLAVNTSPFPIAFRRSCVMYTGVGNSSRSFKRLAYTGMTSTSGISSTSCFGSCRARHPFSKSQRAPSRYKPSTYVPSSNFALTCDLSVNLVTLV